MVAQLQPARHEGQFIEPRVPEQPREALESPVQRLLGVREGPGEVAQTERRPLEQRREHLGKAFVLGLPPGRREVLAVANEIGVCCRHRRLLNAEVGETLSVLGAVVSVNPALLPKVGYRKRPRALRRGGGYATIFDVSRRTAVASG